MTMTPIRRCTIRRAILPLTMLLLMMPIIGHAEDEPERTQVVSTLAEHTADRRMAQLLQLHEFLDIRDDQAALWKQMENRLAPLYKRSARLITKARHREPKGELDRQKVLNDVIKAEAFDQRRVLDALRWLYPQLDTAQRSALDDLNFPETDSPCDLEVIACTERSASYWLERRDILKWSLVLRPGQMRAWNAFEGTTASPFARTLAFLKDGGRKSMQPPFAQMEVRIRLQELQAQDADDCLASARRLGRGLDGRQKTTLDLSLICRTGTLL